ncbi:hypothetical protein GHNINEIG_01282 [Hydrogenovibrio crunogenus]|uniref:Uncharacterized protein n=1 Tax=Hydrogenovibrio crunogenus TaxID=39765 RepID=A0A4V1C8V6_9GAMM|nr:hypothetical protein GHNINEIG_01282 [Hydrogenovibrio crunogenus]
MRFTYGKVYGYLFDGYWLVESGHHSLNIQTLLCE